MAKTVERTERDQETVREVLAELRALPADAPLSREQILAYLERMPPRPHDFSSADVIRELRGPLPDDDPEFQRKIRRRR
jgi:hypothetical protein